MPQYRLIFRDYKGVKNPAGWYLLVDGKQSNYYGYSLSEDQRKTILLELKMHEWGYARVNDKTFRQQKDDDMLVEIKELEHNYEVSDIKRDSDSGKMVKEPAKERDYTRKNIDSLDVVL
jgi:hypothetical protein